MVTSSRALLLFRFNLLLALFTFTLLPTVALADKLHLTDGTTIEADEAWDDPQGVWYRRGGVTYLVERAHVSKIEHEQHTQASDTPKRTQTSRVLDASAVVGQTTQAPQPGARATDIAAVTSNDAPHQPVLIYLIGGASFEVDDVNESADGVWYKRGSLSIFIERARIERIERERPDAIADAKDDKGTKHERRWTTGSARLDSLIKQNGVRYGVDPYLVFCVMEQESHFNSGAVSPMGARGLMQLMPGTAARFGVRRPHDAAQNVMGGTRYLKELLGKFNGRVDLVLASYNAGEGAVRRYGGRVPPFRETRAYVRQVGGRYGSAAHHAPQLKAVTGDK
ncbi:MAG TPA: lytic transglycosylase domain-containing protein [Pyrinomonadaceae bacterium]|nr:lytic transglycosylase domain-containing protein [Pyrinomonadaceae bacterium]